MAEAQDWNLEQLKEAYDGLRDSYHKLQEGWDREIQLRKDDAAAHEQALTDAGVKLANTVDAIEADHAKELEAAYAAHKEQIENLQVDHGARVASINKDHANELAELKAKTLAPALKDYHARQVADLQAKHQAELDLVR